jgi:Flp pilus assembly pilin Flp
VSKELVHVPEQAGVLHRESNPMNRHSHYRSEPNAPDRGATLVEYLLMLSLIVLVALAGVSALGTTLSDNVDDSASRVVTASGGTYGG